MPTTFSDFLLADRIWIAVALLHQELPMRQDFSKDEIRRKLDESKLTVPDERASVNPHLKQHMVANVAPSTTRKYRMLFETPPGNLRLYRVGDRVDAGRRAHRNPKYAPNRDNIPPQYRHLLDWYENWRGESEGLAKPSAEMNWEDDPLIRLMGSGKHIWADEHADEYVENLRREDI